jgi:Protein of unknown function (DUF3039)
MGFIETQDLPDLDTELSHEEGDHDRFAHYVHKDAMMEAYVEGKPVVAMCGKVWVPTRDPSKFPMCPVCKELYEMIFSK